jgi:protoporphyrinogen oxidase
MPSTVIVGAGVAGLTLGHQLATGGHDVTIVERLGVVGGLGRTFRYGDFCFDVGPHRFHTENPRVAAYIRRVLEDEVLEIPRKSGVRMFGRFHEWPLRPGILLAMPLTMMVLGLRDLLFRSHLPGDSFEAEIVNSYGRTLHDMFFAPYTEKFLFLAPRSLHKDWAKAGVNRAVIDKRAASDSLWSLLKNTLLPKPVETTFLYPPQGVGRFSERAAAAIERLGGRIVLGAEVTGLEMSDDRITAVQTASERLPAHNVVWTGPLTTINRHLGIEGVDLTYLSTIFYNLEIRKPLKVDYQWTYYGGDEIFSRVSAPVAFAASTAPPGKSGLCVEFTCHEGDERWTHADRYVDAMIEDLVRTKTIDSKEDVERVHIERVPFSYPVYKLNYLGELTRNLRAVARYRNLLLAGRCGRFWYNNMDHSIGQALTMADRILKGQVLADIDEGQRDFWTAEEDGGVAVREEEIAEPLAPASETGGIA